MATITLKNIPDELYEHLKQLAASNHHSVNSEIIACLESVLHPQQRNVEQVLAQAQSLRQQAKLPPLKIEELIAAKDWGRP